MTDDTQVQRFKREFEEAGGLLVPAWSTKRHPSNNYNNVTYYFAYGRADKGGSQPLIGGIIINEFGKNMGYEVLVASPNATIAEDVTQILGSTN